MGAFLSGVAVGLFAFAVLLLLAVNLSQRGGDA